MTFDALLRDSLNAAVKLVCVRRLIGAGMFVLGLLTLVSIAIQLRHSIAAGSTYANYFSYFTIQSNIFAAIVLLFAPRAAQLRGAATLYLTITGVVYALILARNDEGLIPWVNLVVHYLMPAAMVASWLADAPPIKDGYVSTLGRWLAYPVLYGVYSLVRGSFTGWYPYEFLNPAYGGYGSVALAAVVVAAFAVAVGAGIAWFAKRGRSELPQP
jgi:hypothetical protein